MDYIVQNFGPITTRRFYSKKPLQFHDLDLLGIQRESYQQFLDTEFDLVLARIFNISVYESRTGKWGRQKNAASQKKKDIHDSRPLLEMKYNSFRAIKPNYTIEDAFFYKKTYASKIIINISLKDYRHKSQILNYESFLADIPLMLDDGSFIINGIKKVVVPQLIRSNGIAFQLQNEPSRQAKIYKFTIQPELGL